MIRALIVDDEKNARDVLRMQLEQYCPEVEIIGQASGGEEGIALIRQLHPELVFLDIEMPGINGFDVLRETSRIPYQVIFTTAYDQFAIRAFKFSAIDYLLKPIDIEELKTALHKFRKSDADLMSTRMNSLFEMLASRQNEKDWISIPAGEGFEIVRYMDIVRCESDSNYTDIILASGKKIKLAKTLKEVELQLPSNQFFRLHHSHLVNINHISKYYKTDGGYVEMTDGSQINISRSRKEEFFELMK